MIHYFYIDEILYSQNKENHTSITDNISDEIVNKLNNHAKINSKYGNFFFFNESDIEQLNDEFSEYKNWFNFNDKETLIDFIIISFDGDLEYFFSNGSSKIDISSQMVEDITKEFNITDEMLENFMNDPENTLNELKAKITELAVNIEIADIISSLKIQGVNVNLGLVNDLVLNNIEYNDDFNINEFKIL